MIRNSIIAGVLVISGVLAGVLLTAQLDWTTPTVAQNVAGPVNADFEPGTGYITENGESPFVAVAERVGPTVVNITSDRVVSRNNSMDDFFKNSPFWEFFQHPEIDQNQGKKREWHSPATGSGMIISRDGYILTN